MEQGEMQEFSFSDIQAHPSLIADLLDKGGDVSLMVRREGDRVTVRSHQTCDDDGTGGMTLEDVVGRTVSLFRHFEENADRIVSEVKPGRASGLLEVMDRLAVRMDAVRNVTDLLTMANIMHDLTIEIPLFPPDDEPPEHFRPEDLRFGGDDHHKDVGRHKAALREAFMPCFERIEQAWWDKPSVIPETASKGPKEPDWELIRRLRDDPSWDEFFEEIERERDKDLIWTEG